MLMVFADPADREQVTGLAEQLGGRVLEWYTSYALAEVPDDAARRRLEELFRVQDLTARYEVQAGGRRLDTSRPRIDREGTVHSHPDYADEAPLPPGPHHYLVQFIGPVKQEWLAGVDDAGGRPRGKHGHFTYVVRAEEDAVNRIAGLDYVRWLGHLPYSDRISRSARDAAAAPPGAIRAPQLQRVYTIELFHRDEVDAARLAAERLGFEIIAVEPGIGVMVVRTDAEDEQSRLGRLAEVHGVMKVRPRFLGETANNRAIRWMGIARATGDPELGLDGTGQVVAVCDSGLDTGKDGPEHKDFRRPGIEIIPYPVAPDARSVNIRSSDVPFRVVLAYSDASGERLINHLNRIVVPPAGCGTKYHGNEAGRQWDLNNNVEVVEVEHPPPRRWRIEVGASHVREGPQDFALVYRCDM